MRIQIHVIRCGKNPKETNNDAEINDKGIGGIEIMIWKKWNWDIYEIARHPHRCVKMAINTGMGGEGLRILNTYAPRANYKKPYGATTGEM